MQHLLAVGLLIASTSLLGYRTTWTRSLPLGLYRSLAVSPDAVATGDLVLICLPAEVGRWARGRGYLAEGTCPGETEPVGKPVAAAADQRLTLRRSGITCGRRLLPHSRFAASDSRGRPMPHPPYGSFQIPADHLWLHAPHPRSLDSRVYGSVPRANVRAVLRPVVVSGYPLDCAHLVHFLSSAAAALAVPFLPTLLVRPSRGT